MAENKQNEYPNVPPLRFPEFSEPWERKKLSCFLYENKERNKTDFFSKEDVLSVSGDLGIVNQIELLGRSFAGKSVKDYHVVRNGNIVYTKSPLKEYPYGIIKYNRGIDGIVSTLYAVYHVLDNADGRFIEFYFSDKGRINRYLKPIVRIGAKHDMKIGNEEVLDNYVVMPSLVEQDKIATFIELLNKRIAVQSKLIEDLKQLKSALVDELFCGKSNWETYKYKEILHPVGERNKTLKINNVLSASQEHGMISRDELDIDIKFESSAISTYKIVQPGDYVLHLRSFQGGLAFSRITGICSPAYTILRPTKAVTYGFFEEFFMSKRFINSLRLVTYGIRDGRSINVDELLNMNISIPNMDTQRKLVQILSVFRQRLNNAQTILQKYILQKQYLLRKMFI